MEPFCYNATVVRIVDGDTIRLDIDLGFDIILKNQSVRLYKVDTPECRTRDLKEKAAGLLAKVVVQDLVAVGERVFIRTKLDTKGKFGRLLGTIITADNLNINEHLIDNNYAVEYYGQSKTEVQSKHEENYNILVERKELSI
jgi:micrococcal nuclease|tara:strand:- start:891 stop:1316 length:426 start_codon:yes stop_codon:yes gene_type:complete